MSKKGDLAECLFKKGYNCSQAVLCAFCDETGLSRETSQMLSSSFGGGMGRMREVCGAVSGMFMVIGLLCGYTDESDSKEKAQHYALIQELASKFKEQNGSIICRELLGLNTNEVCPPVPDKRTDTYYKKRPCSELVRIAAEITESELQKRGLLK